VAHLKEKIVIAMPIGHWSPLFKASLTSIRRQPDVYALAIMDASNDPRVKADVQASGLTPDYWRMGPDAGQAAAIAEGWRSCDGSVLAWLNGDDMLVPHVLGRVAERFSKDPGLDVLHGHSTISDASGNYLGLHPEVRSVDDFLLRSNVISQPSCFMRREALDHIGGLDESLHYTMDWDVWARLYRAGRTFVYTDKVLSNVTWATGTKTASLPWQRLVEIYHLLRRSHPPYPASKGVLGVLLHHLAFYMRNKTSLATAAARISDVPILNLSNSDRSSLLVQIKNGDESVHCACENARIGAERDTFFLDFAKPVAPGAAVRITLQTDADSRAVFDKASWG